MRRRGERGPNVSKANPHGDAAMSFEEIGECLGMTRGGAWMAYKSGMQKLQRGHRLAQFLVILQLARSKEEAEI